VTSSSIHLGSSSAELLFLSSSSFQSKPPGELIYFLVLEPTSKDLHNTSVKAPDSWIASGESISFPACCHGHLNTIYNSHHSEFEAVISTSNEDHCNFLFQFDNSLQRCLSAASGVGRMKVRHHYDETTSSILIYAGFTFDSILSFVNSTALNPWLSLPLYAYSLYTPRGRELAASRPKLASWLKTCAMISALKRVSSFLDMGVTNNWTNDTYDWSKEVVLVTGGSDGIGAIVVQLLAEKGMKVVILDVQPPKYPGQ
jgi:hypothetical protein